MVAHTLEHANTCTCRYCPTCEMSWADGYAGNGMCPECSTEGEFFDCYGMCYEDTREALQEVIDAWVAANCDDSDTPILITGADMGWRHLSGWQDTTAGDLGELGAAERLVSVDSQWVQQWTVDPVPGGVCQCVQSHHDSMGERYVFRPVEGPWDGLGPFYG